MIEFYAWNLAYKVGLSRDEYTITTFVSNIIKLESYYLHEDKDKSDMKVFAVTISGLTKYFITCETYNKIKERMHKLTPIKIEEIICVERVYVRRSKTKQETKKERNN